MEKENSKEIINAMVIQLKQDTNYLSITGWKEGTKMFYYDKGIFHRFGEEHINEVLRSFPMSTTHAQWVEARRMLIAETPCAFEDLDKDIYHLACENGMINLMTGGLEEFDPKYKATIKIPIKYDPTATCPKIDKFLSEVVHPENVPLLEEIVGYCLLRSSRFKAIFFPFGDTDSGKSTYVELLENFLGKENVSSQTIQALGNPMLKFNDVRLLGKMINTCAEIPVQPIKETGKLKALSSGDSIEGEEKFGNFIRFNNYAKLIFASNHGIQFPEEEVEFMMSRMKFILFPNHFEKNETFFPTLITSEELSGLLNKALIALRRLIKNKEFSNHKTIEENLAIYYDMGDTVSKFVHERIEKNVMDGWVAKTEIKAAYDEFCVVNKLRSVKMGSFWEKFKVALGFKQDNDFSPTVKGKQIKAIWGISMKSPEDIKKDEIKKIETKKEVIPKQEEIKTAPVVVPVEEIKDVIDDWEEFMTPQEKQFIEDMRKEKEKLDELEEASDEEAKKNYQNSLNLPEQLEPETE